MSIITISVSIITVLVSQNVIFSECFMNMSHDSNNKSSPSTSPTSQVCLLFFKKTLYQPLINLIWLLWRIMHFWSETNFFFWLIAGRFSHSHKKRKNSLEIRAACSWILILTWNLDGGRGHSTSNFYKITSASWFWCS